MIGLGQHLSIRQEIIYAKAEWFNPGGSVKDRAALSMILDVERKQILRSLWSRNLVHRSA